MSSTTSSLFSSLSSTNTPQKRISEIFESSLTPTGSLVILFVIYSQICFK